MFRRVLRADTDCWCRLRRSKRALFDEQARRKPASLRSFTSPLSLSRSLDFITSNHIMDNCTIFYCCVECIYLIRGWVVSNTWPLRGGDVLFEEKGIRSGLATKSWGRWPVYKLDRAKNREFGFYVRSRFLHLQIGPPLNGYLVAFG